MIFNFVFHLDAGLQMQGSRAKRIHHFSRELRKVRLKEVGGLK
jgi:hypothetical protein